MRPAFAVLLTAVVLFAATVNAAPERSHDIVAEDYFSLSYLIAVAASPDGGNVAYAEMRWAPPEKTRNIDLWVVSSKGGKSRRLTFDQAADVAPHWSPDGKWLYFASGRKRSGETRPPHRIACDRQRCCEGGALLRV